MTTKTNEIYHPRRVSNLGIWRIDTLQLKVYGITAQGKEITDAILRDAKEFASSEISNLVKTEGKDNGLGFVIIHQGSDGVSVLVHWWVQGCVLCQHIRRTLCGAQKPMNTATRPVIACVWELGLINAEQTIWRNTMMVAKAKPAEYLSLWADIDEV